MTKNNSVNKLESYNRISLLEQTGFDTILSRECCKVHFPHLHAFFFFELDVLIYSKIRCGHGTTIVFTAAH